MKKPPYASAFSRFLAYAIDIAVIITIFMGLGFFLGMHAVFNPLTALPLFGLWWYGGMLIASWLYFALMESSAMQATIGKRCLKLCVADLDFTRISFWRASGRYFGKLLSRLMFFFGFVMILFTKKRQGLHDKLTRTVVLSTKHPHHKRGAKAS
ncbi:MAG: hypothetical protein K940chlam2_00673 [Chlamydiae bacterium]|nr:hypothetical protein [Chlamydiota bacterium]